MAFTETSIVIKMNSNQIRDYSVDKHQIELKIKTMATKTKTAVEAESVFGTDTYQIYHRPITTRGRDGGKLTSTLYATRPGDAFFFPGKRKWNIERAANREGMQVDIEAYDPGFVVTRIS